MLFRSMKIATDFAKGSKNDREELFVADCDGVLAGCIMLCQADDPSVGQLRLFAVEKDYRRYGIGSALIAAFMQKAKDSGSSTFGYTVCNLILFHVKFFH